MFEMDIISASDLKERTNEIVKNIKSLEGVIDRIEVIDDGKIDIYLKLLTEIGLSEKNQFNSDRTYGGNLIERICVEVA